MSTEEGRPADSQGVTEAEVLEAVLGARANAITGNRWTDCLNAYHKLVADHDAFLLHRRVVLHGLYGVIKAEGQVTDIWGELAVRLGYPRSTVNRWGNTGNPVHEMAHPPGIRHEEGSPDQEVYD